MAERPLVEEAVRQVCGRVGLAVKRVPEEHAGGKWRLSYTTVFGRPGVLELDVNFIFRTPLWPISPQVSHAIGDIRPTQFPLLDKHELVAGKLAALVARRASRDVFDANALLKRRGWLDPAKLRLGFVVYGGVNRVDWRQITVDTIDTSTKDVETQLVPMLHAGVRPSRDQIPVWTETLIRETRELMSVVLPLTDREHEFLTRLNDEGEIVPELLTDEHTMQGIIRDHPGLKWKADNVKEHIKGLASPKQ